MEKFFIDPERIDLVHVFRDSIIIYFSGQQICFTNVDKTKDIASGDIRINQKGWDKLIQWLYDSREKKFNLVWET